MRLTPCKWEDLGKEHAKRTKTRKHFMSYMGSSEENEEQNITIVRFFCKRHAHFKSETAEGTIKATEMISTGLFGNSDEESTP